jgi:hypothetical protein
MRVLVFTRPEDGGLSVVYPTDPNAPDETVAAGAVPAGVPYRAMDSGDLPPRTSPEHRQAWKDTGTGVVVDTTRLSDALAAKIQKFRTLAKTAIQDAREDALRDRAVALSVLDELNNLRSWITSFTGAVAASTNLADLKTRVAALPAMPQRTIAQAKTAITQKIDDGTAD